MPDEIEKFIRLKRIQLDINDFKERERKKLLKKGKTSGINKDLMKELAQDHPMNLDQIESLDPEILLEMERARHSP